MEASTYMCECPRVHGKEEGTGESELLLTGGQNMKPKEKQCILHCAFAFPSSWGKTLKGMERGKGSVTWTQPPMSYTWY